MVLFGVLSSLAIILQSDRAVCFNFVVAVYVLCLFLMVPWVGLQSVIVACPVLTYTQTPYSHGIHILTVNHYSNINE